MIKQYFKQALSMLRENPLISVISILGTALSIAMIMIVILVFQVQLTSFVPEVNRDRMLYVEQGTEVKTKNSWSRGNMSVEAVRECFYSLKTPEAVSGWFTMLYPLSLPGKQMFKTYSIFYTDPGFWKVYAFSFLEGKPFTEADFTSGIPQAVVCESVARGLYGTTQVVGKPVIIDRQPFTICGVVKDVSRAADSSYGQVWTPYTTNQMVLNMTYIENMSGAFNVCMLARNASDFEAIRQELKGQIARYNSTKQEAEISFFHNPITRFDKAIGTIGQIKVELKDYLAEMGGLLLFLLLVPALNLMGVTQSAVQKRRGEMGVRKAFGATSGILVRQVLYENGVTTLLGGVIGLILSFLLLPACRDFLLANTDTTLQGDMLFKPGIFLIALLFCLLLNLLSAGIPALRIAREQIAGSLKGEDSLITTRQGEDVLRLVGNIRQEDKVEEVSLSHVGCVYTENRSWSTLYRADADTFIKAGFRRSTVTPEYFTVLRMKEKTGKELSSIVGQQTGIVVSADLERVFYGENGSAKGQSVKYHPDNTDEMLVLAVSGSVRESEYKARLPFYYQIPTREVLIKAIEENQPQTVDCLVRMKSGFRAEDMEAFLQEMGDRLTVNNVYVSSVVPLSEMRSLMLKSREDNMKKKTALVAFMLINVFFGIIGTFWLRTQARQGEMGLRIALGSNRSQLSRLMNLEGLILLALTVPFMLVFILNMLYFELPDTVRLPYTWWRFAVTFGGAYLLMAGMICLGIWFPIRKTRRMEPAEALHYE